MIAIAAGTPLVPFTTGQSVLAWILAVVIVASALGVAFSRKAVHAAIYMVSVMLSLSIIYFAQGAEFLGAVQIVVYTGAIMMLFLFVIMLVGVQGVDNPRENKSYVLVPVILLGLAFLVATVTAVARNTWLPSPERLPEGSNPVMIATELISKHYFAMELVATLLIIAAVGAMALTHSDRLLPKISQRFVAAQRMKAYKEQGVHPGQFAPPGVYATSNALDVPALDSDGRPVEESVPMVMRVRGEVRSVAEAAPWVVRRVAEARDGGPGLYGPKATRSVGRSGAWGMKGPDAPQLPQPASDAATDLTVSQPEAPAPASEEKAQSEGKGEEA